MTTIIKKISFAVCLLTFILSLSTIELYAYWPLSTDDAGVGPLNTSEVKARYDMGREDKTNTHVVGHELLIGLGKASLAFAAPYTLNEETRGINNVTIFGKFLCLGSSNDSGMLTIKTVYNAPGKSYDLMLLGSKQLFGNLLAHINVGLKSDFNKDYLTYGFALDYKIIEKLNFVSEISGQYSKDIIIVNYLGGFIIKPIENIAIHIAGGVGITDKATDFVFTTGSTFMIK